MASYSTAAGLQHTLNPGESILMAVDSCSLEVKVTETEDALLQIVDGSAKLTSHRLIFAAADAAAMAPGSVYHGVEVPLSLMRNANYEQPWFSANNFTFTCMLAPSQGVGANKDATFKVVFNSMGGDQFMQQWAHLNARAAVQRAPTAPPMASAASARSGAADSGANANSKDSDASSGGARERGSAAMSTAYVSKSNPHKVLLQAQAGASGAAAAPPSDDAADTAAHPVYHKKNA